MNKKETKGTYKATDSPKVTKWFKGRTLENNKRAKSLWLLKLSKNENKIKGITKGKGSYL